jgi:DNA-binding response OmpR family regulator
MPKVMLIEDDQTMLSLLKTLLEIEGYEAVLWHSEDSILDVLKAQRPDLVLLDVHLKGEDGFSLLRRIRGHESLKEVCVLMTSGMDFASQCIQEGADGFILKPYMPAELMREIRRLLSGSNNKEPSV